MNYIKTQLSHAIENQEELIRVFAAEPEQKLADRLHIIHLQSVICQNEKDEETSEFLEIMRRIVIEARLYKWDNNIPDELNEIELSVADSQQAQEKLVHRKKLLAKLAKPALKPEVSETPFQPEKDNSIQLGLF